MHTVELLSQCVVSMQMVEKRENTVDRYVQQQVGGVKPIMYLVLIRNVLQTVAVISILIVDMVLIGSQLSVSALIAVSRNE